ATKKFDATKKLSPEQLDIVLESLRLSASSYGLQPWKFIVVTNPEIRAKLRASAWNQTQVTDASHLIVLAVQKNVDAAYVDRFVSSVAETRHMPVDALKGYADMMKGAISSRTPESVKEWSSRQVYVALGTALTAAAVSGIDACPMEGFDTAAFDEILGLAKLGLESRVLMPVGFRASDDDMAKAAKVRLARKDVVIEVK
ncbi:MAG: NAD(P)H-dependent oxidoreductase, partial [Candidatus Taylorbacteria bacterium]